MNLQPYCGSNIDFGRKDSLVTDSTVFLYFIHSLRFEHNIQFDVFKYSFQDYPNYSSTVDYVPDSAYYQDNYGLTHAARYSGIFREMEIHDQ